MAGVTSAGKGYVLYGRTTWPHEIDLAAGGADITLLGSEEGGHACCAMSAGGDFDGDGLADLVVGAKGVDAYGRYNSGEAYLIYGRDALGSTIVLSSASDLILTGATVSGAVGRAVHCGGDIDIDGFDDLLICSSGGATAEQGEGVTYVIFGGKKILGHFDLDLRSNVYIKGPTRGNAAGDSIDVSGDVNRDGITDIVIGADTPSETYVVLGRRDWPKRIDLGVETDSTLYGEHGFSLFGRSVSCGGDVNGDGYADVLVGADLAGSGGKAYLIYGSPLPLQLRVKPNPGRNGNERIFHAGDILSLEYSIHSSYRQPPFSQMNDLAGVLGVQYSPTAWPPYGGGQIYLFKPGMKDVYPAPQKISEVTPTFYPLCPGTLPDPYGGTMNLRVPEGAIGEYCFIGAVGDTGGNAYTGIVRSNRFRIE